MGRAQNEKHSVSSRTEHAPVAAWMASQPGGETYLFINRFGLSTSGAPRLQVLGRLHSLVRPPAPSSPLQGAAACGGGGDQ